MSPIWFVAWMVVGVGGALSTISLPFLFPVVLLLGALLGLRQVSRRHWWGLISGAGVLLLLRRLRPAPRPRRVLPVDPRRHPVRGLPRPAAVARARPAVPDRRRDRRDPDNARRQGRNPAWLSGVPIGGSSVGHLARTSPTTSRMPWANSAAPPCDGCLTGTPRRPARPARPARPGRRRPPPTARSSPARAPGRARRRPPPPPRAGGWRAAGRRRTGASARCSRGRRRARRPAPRACGGRSCRTARSSRWACRWSCGTAGPSAAGRARW